MNNTVKTNDINEFQNYLVEGNYEKCSEFVHDILKKDADIKFLYDEIIKKSLYRIGEMWEASKITVATEHLASAIVETILSEVYFKVITQNKIEKTVVVACTENEFHQVGIKMVSDIFQMNGWQVHFLGVNTSTEELIQLIEKVNPDMLAISLSIPFNLPTLEKALDKIKSHFPDLFVLVGGQAFLHGGLDVLEKYNKIMYKPDLNELEEFLKAGISN